MLRPFWICPHPPKRAATPPKSRIAVACHCCCIAAKTLPASIPRPIKRVKTPMAKFWMTVLLMRRSRRAKSCELSTVSAGGVAKTEFDHPNRRTSERRQRQRSSMRARTLLR